MLTWSSQEEDSSFTIAWGDMDNDGDLDLAVGNHAEPDRVYRNEEGTLTQTAVWSSTETDITRSIAWGDVDNDGDLDLAVGVRSGYNRLYLNAGGTLGETAVWSSGEADNTSSIDWGDVDGDGDLDLAVGNDGQPNRIYRNTNGELSATAVWSSAENDATRSIAWGDVDNDGDLDLATGRWGASNTIYRNDDGVLTTTAVWSSGEVDNTSSIGWGDMDGDGDLDLATGNFNGPNRLYRNDGMWTFTPVWSSTETDATESVSWGDMDGDGDLDLATGNRRNPNRIYRNDNGVFTPIVISQSPRNAPWTNSIAWADIDGDGDLDLAVGHNDISNQIYRNDSTTLMPAILVRSIEDTPEIRSIAWGDVDGDGDLDLAVGYHNAPNHLYRNNSGVLDPVPVWESTEADLTQSVAWGDMDNDGDLDLAVGNWKANRLYRNDSGTLSITAVWTSVEETGTASIAWGDVDNDGDLDLAAGDEKHNRLYRNDNGSLMTSAVWVSSEGEATGSLAWGDIDNDGDLDLAAGNYEGSNQVYRNDNGTLTSDAAWQSDEVDRTKSVAWGDMDGDGDLDLAAGNFGQPNRLYRNDEGTLASSAIWRTNEEEDSTQSITWQDVDGDGDLDLTVGNRLDNVNARLYHNVEGLLNMSPTWTSRYTTEVRSIAWGDVDGDGDLDLATGGEILQLYYNTRNDRTVHVRIAQPDGTAGAAFYATARTVRQPTIPITYTLADPHGTPVREIRAFYSPTGGGQWFPATPAPGTPTTNLAADRDGSTHTFTWNVAADLIKSDNVVVRIEAYEGFTRPGPYQRTFGTGQTFPFRVEADWFAKVVDPAGTPVPGARVFSGGQPITAADDTPQTTDHAGLVRLDPLPTGQPLVALSPVLFEQPTARGAHAGWAYRVHTTSLAWSNQGDLQTHTVTGPGEQRLVLHPSHPLILFNLVVSLEWAATDAELQQIERAMQSASAYLYDVTDGQMAFQQVAIYDNAQHWEDADIQFLTNNITRPHAYIDGIRSPDTAHVIRLGRAWDGISGRAGPWDAPEGYRTIVHEFGHYALGLYDAYFGFRRAADGTLLSQYPASCTGTENRSAATDATNATVMDYQYTSSELAMRGVAGLWSAACEQTAQWQLHGESDWETLVRVFADTADPPRWQMTTPQDRGGVLAGPATWPAVLPAWPQVTTVASDFAGTARQVTVVDPQGQPQKGAIVALYKPDKRVLGQGFTDADGYLEVYGAEVGDTLRVATMDGGLAARQSITPDTALQIALQPVNSSGATLQTSQGIPHVRVIPNSGPTTGEVALTLVLHNFGTTVEPQALVTVPGSTQGFAPTLNYSPTRDTYEGQVTFSADTAGTGQVQVVGDDGGQLVQRQSSYRVQRVVRDAPGEVFSDDGNLWLYLAEESIPGKAAYLAVMPPGALPGPLPAGMTIVGDAYDLTASGALVALERPALLRLRYDPDLAAGNPGQIGLYRWEPDRETWQPVAATLNAEHQTLSAPVTLLGTYALLVTTPSSPPLQQQVFLPFVGVAVR
jgi:hypothetical protein